MIFTNELEFQEWLKKQLENKKVVDNFGSSTSVKKIKLAKAGENEADLRIYFNDNIKLKWKELSNPLKIECKINGGGWSNYSLLQILKYKKEPFEKFSDHICIATPQSCSEKSNYGVYENSKDINFFFIRILWNLGIGCFGWNGKNYFCRFNEQERIYFVDSLDFKNYFTKEDNKRLPSDQATDNLTPKNREWCIEDEL